MLCQFRGVLPAALVHRRVVVVLSGSKVTLLLLLVVGVVLVTAAGHWRPVIHLVESARVPVFDVASWRVATWRRFVLHLRRVVHQI